MSLWARALFAIRHKTLGRIAVRPDEPGHVFVYHEGASVRLKRRCPHQGALLEKGRVQGGRLVCPWHGYRLSLTGGAGEVSVPSAGRRG